MNFKVYFTDYKILTFKPIHRRTVLYKFIRVHLINVFFPYTHRLQVINFDYYRSVLFGKSVRNSLTNVAKKIIYMIFVCTVYFI